jgi:hypothetical protein
VWRGSSPLPDGVYRGFGDEAASPDYAERAFDVAAESIRPTSGPRFELLENRHLSVELRHLLRERRFTGRVVVVTGVDGLYRYLVLGAG